MLNTLKFAQLLQQAPGTSSACPDEIFLTLDKLAKEGFDKDDIVAVVQKFRANKIIAHFHIRFFKGNKKAKVCIFVINRPSLDSFVVQHSKIVAEPVQVYEVKGKANFKDEKISPYCETAKGWGWLKFSLNSEPIKIGKPNSQAFRLLQSLTEPFGIAKSVESVFEAIRENVKAKNKTGVYTSYTDKGKKLELLRYAIKELQKDHKLQGRLEFKFDELKNHIHLEYTG
jgi:hypothetical protein